MAGQVLELLVEILIADFDFLFGGDAVNDEFGLHIVLGAFFLAAAEADPIHVYGAGIHALLCQGAHHAFEAHIHLMLDERFRHGEIVQLDQFGEDLFAREILLAVVALVFETFVDFLFQLVEGGGVADVLGEFVVEFRKLLGFDAEDVHGIVKGLAGELGVGIVGGVGDVEILVIAGAGAAQIFVERLHGFFGADVAKDALGFQRFPAAFGRAEKFDLDEIAVLDGAAFDGSKSGGALLHLSESFGDAFVGDGHFGEFDFEILVIAEGKFGQNLKRSAEFYGLAFVVFELVHLGLGNGRELFFGDGFFDALGDQGLQDFALDVFGETLFDERERGLAGTEAGNSSDPRQIPWRPFRFV